MNNHLDLGDCPELEDWASESIGDTYSFKAINPAGEIIGVIINGIVEKNVRTLVYSNDLNSNVLLNF